MGDGGGVGCGRVGCTNVLAQCTRIGRSPAIHFHLLAHCIHVLVSMEGVGLGWGGVRSVQSRTCAGGGVEVGAGRGEVQ